MKFYIVRNNYLINFCNTNMSKCPDTERERNAS
jgi:hypothetical protein